MNGISIPEKKKKWNIEFELFLHMQLKFMIIWKRIGQQYKKISIFLKHSCVYVCDKMWKIQSNGQIMAF